MTTTTPKIFGQAKPVANVETTLLTTAYTSQAQLSIFVANQSDAIDRFSIEIIPFDTSPDLSRFIAYNTPLLGNGIFAVSSVALNGGDQVIVSTANGDCSFTATGLQFDA